MLKTPMDLDVYSKSPCRRVGFMHQLGHSLDSRRRRLCGRVGVLCGCVCVCVLGVLLFFVKFPLANGSSC